MHYSGLSLLTATQSAIRKCINALANTAGSELASANPERKVDFVIADDMSVEGDPVMLRIVIENLLGNAWKFSGKRSAARIEFGMTTSDGNQAYFVKDNGVGFDMRYAEYCLGRFSAYTQKMNSRVLELVLLQPSRLSFIVMAGIFSRRAKWIRERHFTSPCINLVDLWFVSLFLQI